MKRLLVFATGVVMAVVASGVFSPLVRSQAVPPQSGATDQNEQPPAHDGWGRPLTAPVKNQKAARAPCHDISD
jgi:hypothetical protein